MKKKTKAKIYEIPSNEDSFLEFRENIHQVLWRMPVDTDEITYISLYAEKIFVLPLEAIHKAPKNWMSFIVPEDLPKLIACIDQIKHGATDLVTETKILRPDGFIAVLLNQLFASKDAQGNVIAILGITSDITAQHHLNLQKRLRAELHKNLSQTQDIKLFALETLKSICLAIGYDVGELWIFDDKENTLSCLVAWLQDPLRAKFDNPKILVDCEDTKNTFQILCLEHNIIQYSTHASHLKKNFLDAAGASIDLKEVVGVPIVVSKHKIGVMCFYNRRILNLDVDGYKILFDFAEEFGKYIQNDLLINRLKYATDYDALTGLYNQYSFVNKINALINDNAKPVIINLRVNNLQLINYAFGFDVGNKVLLDISQKIADFALIYSDSMTSIDMVALTEPGVFGFLSHQFGDRNTIMDFANMLLELVKKPIKKNNLEIFLTASIGISLYPENGTNAYQLLGSAILALIESLKEGSNMFKFATQDTSKKTSHVLEIETAMHQALKNNEFELYYQPKVSLKTGKITGAEALIRWRDPNNILRLPDYFIPVCEQSDLIILVGEWVLTEAIKAITQMENPVRASINLSALQFAPSYNLVEKVKQLILASGIEPKYIEFEVTETLLMSNRERTSKIIKELKQLGISIYLDDFGTGYSSFAYLKNFAPDVIKIDKSFMDGVPQDVNGIKIILAMISVSHNLGLTVIAEGVETAAQVNFLMGAGCDDIQGYYFSKPVSFLDFEAMVKNDKRLDFPD